MKEIKANLWSFYEKNDFICITTNGTIKKNGEAVMGRGCALECKKRFPNIQKKLGQLIKQNGNIVQFIEKRIISFPVKYNWWENGDIELIKKSCQQLNELIVQNNLEKAYLPRPGCGNGNLNWDFVEKEISLFLNDNVIVVSF